MIQNVFFRAIKEDIIGLEKYLSKTKDLKWPEYPALTLLSALRYDFDAASEYLTSLEFPSPAERWTEEEKRLFLSSFGLYGKNFEKIHVWLKNKTMKELIEFYYFLKSKKQIISPGFQQVRVDFKTTVESCDHGLTLCSRRKHLQPIPIQNSNDVPIKSINMKIYMTLGNYRKT